MCEIMRFLEKRAESGARASSPATTRPCFVLSADLPDCADFLFLTVGGRDERLLCGTDAAPPPKRPLQIMSKMKPVLTMKQTEQCHLQKSVSICVHLWLKPTRSFSYSVCFVVKQTRAMPPNLGDLVLAVPKTEQCAPKTSLSVSSVVNESGDKSRLLNLLLTPMFLILPRFRR